MWDGKWWDDDVDFKASPDFEGGKDYVYWWDDMRPREVLKLIEEVYEDGYERGRKES